MGSEFLYWFKGLATLARGRPPYGRPAARACGLGGRSRAAPPARTDGPGRPAALIEEVTQSITVAAFQAAAFEGDHGCGSTIAMLRLIFTRGRGRSEDRYFVPQHRSAEKYGAPYVASLIMDEPSIMAFLWGVRRAGLHSPLAIRHDAILRRSTPSHVGSGCLQ